MTADQIIAMTASIGACLTAVSSFFILKQNSKQRQASYRPQFAIKNISFEANPVTDDSFSIPENWESHATNIEFPQNPQYFSLSLINIGLGSAKQIQLEWEFDLTNYTNHINKKAQESLVSAYLEYKNETLMIKSKSIYSSLSIWKNQKKQSLDYVLPVSINKDGASVLFPSAIILAISSDCYFFIQNKFEGKVPDVPKIGLIISYYDLGNKKHIESFELQIHINALSGVKGKPCSFQGYIESIKK